jgi:hypothetical protein
MGLQLAAAKNAIDKLRLCGASGCVVVRDMTTLQILMTYITPATAQRPCGVKKLGSPANSGASGPLWWAPKLKSLAAAQETRCAVANSHAGCEQPMALTPVRTVAPAKRAGVSLVHRVHATAAMTAVARPSSRSEKAQRRQPTAAADPAPARRTAAPRHLCWTAPRLPRRRPPLPELERCLPSRCPRVRHRAPRRDRRRACSALARAGTRTS